MKTFTRKDMVKMLYDEFEAITEFNFPDFFLEEFKKYLTGIYNWDKLEFSCDPYIIGERKKTGKDEFGNDIYQAPLVLCNDPFSLGPDDKVYWLTTMKIYYNNDKLLPREYERIDCTVLRDILIGLLTERAEQIFDTENPEVDVLLNVIADIAEFNEKNGEEPPYPYNQYEGN